MAFRSAFKIFVYAFQPSNSPATQLFPVESGTPYALFLLAAGFYICTVQMPVEIEKGTFSNYLFRSTGASGPLQLFVFVENISYVALHTTAFYSNCP